MILESGFMTKKTLVILQARMTSTRLPGKVFAKINGMPMIYWQIMRIREATRVDELVVATSTDESDDGLANFLEKEGFLVERGPLNDVLARFLQAVTRFDDFENIVRLTGDCPLVMPDIIDEMVTAFENSNIDYLSNSLEPTFPDGLDIEIIRREALIKLSHRILSALEREHVTLALRNQENEFAIQNYRQPIDLSKMRWTVDYEEDLDFVRRIYSEFIGKETSFGYRDVLSLIRAKPELKNQISGNLRNVALTEDKE